MATSIHSRPHLSALSFAIVGIIALTLFSLASSITADGINYQKRSIEEALSNPRPMSAKAGQMAEKKATAFRQSMKKPTFSDEKYSPFLKGVERNTKRRIQKMLDQLASRPRPVPTDNGIVDTIDEFDDHFMQVYANILQRFQHSGELLDSIGANINKVNKYVNPGSVSASAPLAPPIPLVPENPTSYSEMDEKMQMMFLNIISEMSHMNASIDVVQDAILETSASLFPNTETYKFDPCEEGFGYSIAVKNDYMIVGAPYANENMNWWAEDLGRAYLYKKILKRWYLVFSFEAGPLPGDYDRSYMNFGVGVAMDYNTSTYVIGAQGAHTLGYNSGAVYVFHCDAEDKCAVTQELWPSRMYKPIGQPPATPAQYDGDCSGALFGNAVAIDGDWILVGSPNDASQDGSSILGSVYFFHLENSAWAYHSKVYGTTEAVGYGYGSLGYSVGIQGAKAVAFNPATRAVYVFEYGDAYWTQTYELVDTFYVYRGQLVSLVLRDDRIVLGANAGFTVMTFNGFDAWYQVHIAMKEGLHVVDLENDTIIVGSPDDRRQNSYGNFGSASIYKYNGRQWKLNALLVSAQAGEYDSLGFAVGLDNGTAYVGAPYAAGGRGSVHVYNDLLVQPEASQEPTPRPSRPTVSPTPMPSPGSLWIASLAV